MVKRLVCVCLLCGAIAIPSSAYAESISTTQNDLIVLFEIFLTGNGTISDGGQKEDFKEWWAKHSKQYPNKDSFEIWQEYYCGDFPGLGWGVGGNTQNPEGEGQFPGQGNGYGWKKWDAGH